MSISKDNEIKNLTNEILKNIELNEITMQQVILKCLRLCRLLNDEEGIKAFLFESTGYEHAEDGHLTKEAWKVANEMGRGFLKKDEKTNENKQYVFIDTIAELENTLTILNERMKAAFDPNISITSANPNQYVNTHSTNNSERGRITNDVKTATGKIIKVKGKIYNYILKIYYSINYGETVEDIFKKSKLYVDNALKEICPEAISKFNSVYENLRKESDEDWSNAVHSCRRILQEVADNLYPAQAEPIILGKKEIKLGKENYKNRLIQYIEKHKGSSSYKKIVGNTLEDIGNKLDSIYDATSKGTHDIVTQEEAERYVIYTYLLISDILFLKND